MWWGITQKLSKAIDYTIIVPESVTTNIGGLWGIVQKILMSIEKELGSKKIEYLALLAED